MTDQTPRTCNVCGGDHWGRDHWAHYRTDEHDRPKIRAALVERLYDIFASDVVLEAEVEEVVAAIEAQARAEALDVEAIAHKAAQIGFTYGALGRDFEYVYKNVNDMLAEARAILAGEKP